MKIGIYSPYLDTAGGGERYMLTIAELLSQESKVDVFLDQHLWGMGADTLKQKLTSHLNLDLSKTNFIPAPLGKGGSAVKRLLFLQGYDVFFYLTDGSIFYTNAKKNILHIQTPLALPQLRNIKNNLKLKSWDLIIYNSKFTKEHAQKYWKRSSVVIYPPVDISKIKPLKKKKIILTVGRFFGYLKEKKHEIMIKTFLDLYKDKNVESWEFHLVGSAQDGDKPYLDELKKIAKNLPIFLHPNLAYGDLVKFYGEASIYWHAMGYQEDDPTKSEHFGITTVEAMAGGCVPVVIKKGGQREIVEDEVSGLFWETVDELGEKTLRLIKDTKKRAEISHAAIEKSKEFSKENFKKALEQII